MVPFLIIRNVLIFSGLWIFCGELESLRPHHLSTHAIVRQNVTNPFICKGQDGTT
jgi:hypothetical protein